MKKFKFVLMLVLVLATLLCFVSCGESKDESLTTTTDAAGNVIQYEGTPAQIINNYFCNCSCCQNNNSSSGNTSNNTIVNNPTADESNPIGSVLYHDEYVKITLQGFDSGLMGPTIKLLFENNGPNNLLIMCRKSSVDGYSIEGSLYAEVIAGKKSVDEITIWQSDLENSGITNPTNFEFVFDITNMDTYANWESDLIYINLNNK